MGRRQDKSVSERAAAVEQDDIQVSFERKMLEAVIEHKDVHSASRQGSLPKAARSLPTQTGTAGRYSDIITGSSPKRPESSAGLPIGAHVPGSFPFFRIPWSKQRDEAQF